MSAREIFMRNIILLQLVFVLIIVITAGWRIGQLEQESENTYINQLGAVWLPWPCNCDTPEECHATWVRMYDRTILIAFEQNWTGEQFVRFMTKQRLGYEDCLGNLGAGITP